MSQVPAWTMRAACLDMPVGLFFPERSSRMRNVPDLTSGEVYAKLVCAGCPVRRECLTWMYEYERQQGVQDGVWGGTLLSERRAVAHTPPCTGSKPQPCVSCRPVEVRIDELLTFTEMQAMGLREGAA